MPRYLITLTPDPTLAAQAHAAILALPGVVGVEEWDDDEPAVFSPESENERAARIALDGDRPSHRRTGSVTLHIDALPANRRDCWRFWTPPKRVREAMRIVFDGADWYVVGVDYDVARGEVRLALLEDLAGDDEGPPYPVADEDDGAP